MSITSINTFLVSLLATITISLSAWFFSSRPIAKPRYAAPPQQAKLVNLLLIPAGDAHNKGRSLMHQFESSCTAALAQELKDLLERQHTAMRVFISHGPTSNLAPWHSANMANTLDIDLAISLHCYHEKGPKPSITIYEFSYGQDFMRTFMNLSWHRAHEAYLFAARTTQAWGTSIAKELSKPELTTAYSIHGPFRMPFKALLGIKVPAIGIEMSIKEDNGEELIAPLIQSLEPVINELINQSNNQVIA